MKHTLYLLLLCAVVTILGCQKDNLDIQPEAEIERSSDRKKKKVKVCHCTGRNNGSKWKVIKVNKNAVKAHLRHGDFKMKDKDGDGFYQDNPCVPADEVDCDDWNYYVNPACAEDPTNGIDDNCDGEIDEGGIIDNDGDGFSADVDCNDEDPAIHPEAAEICGDGIDNNCNGLTDCDDVEECETDEVCLPCGAYEAILNDINTLEISSSAIMIEGCFNGFEGVFLNCVFNEPGTALSLSYGVSTGDPSVIQVILNGSYVNLAGTVIDVTSVTENIDVETLEQCQMMLRDFGTENSINSIPVPCQ